MKTRLAQMAQVISTVCAGVSGHQHWQLAGESVPPQAAQVEAPGVPAHQSGAARAARAAVSNSATTTRMRRRPR